MPTYEYRCPDGHDFEKFFRKISDAPAEVACPVCGKVSERRLSAGAGLLFKGSGFYLTDYGKNAHRKGGGEATASSESKGDSSPSGESKSASASSGASDSSAKSSDAKPAPSPAPKSTASDK